MTGNHHGDPARRAFQDEPGKLDPFRQTQIEHLAGLAYSENAVDPFLYIPFNDFGHAWVIDFVFLRKRGNHRYPGAVTDFLFHIRRPF